MSETETVLKQLRELKGYARHSEELATIDRAIALIQALDERSQVALARNSGARATLAAPAPEPIAEARNDPEPEPDASEPTVKRPRPARAKTKAAGAP